MIKLLTDTAINIIGYFVFLVFIAISFLVQVIPWVIVFGIIGLIFN